MKKVNLSKIFCFLCVIVLTCFFMFGDYNGVKAEIDSDESGSSVDYSDYSDSTDDEEENNDTSTEDDSSSDEDDIQGSLSSVPDDDATEEDEEEDEDDKEIDFDNLNDDDDEIDFSEVDKKNAKKKKKKKIYLECVNNAFSVDVGKLKIYPYKVYNATTSQIENVTFSIIKNGHKATVTKNTDAPTIFPTITGVKKGKAIIQISIGGKTRKCPITIKKADTESQQLNDADSYENYGVILNNYNNAKTNTSDNGFGKASKKLKKITCGKNTVKAGKTIKVKYTKKSKKASMKGVQIIVKKTSKKKIEITSKSPLRVKGLKKGTGKIVFKYNGKTTTCKIKVTNKKKNDQPKKKKAVKVTSVKITGGSKKIKVKEKTKLTVMVNPKKASQKVTWKSSNENVAKVNKNGLVTGVKKGNVIITVTSKSNKTKSASKKITVVDPNNKSNSKVKSVKITGGKSKIKVNEKASFNASVNPKTVSQAVIWSSANENVATVNKNGTVKGKSAGKTTIIAKSKIDKSVSASKNITITKSNSDNKKDSKKNPKKEKKKDNKDNKKKDNKPGKGGVRSVTVSYSGEGMYVGETKTATANITPSSAKQGVKWTSSDKNLATVTKNGQIKALKKGTVKITATSTADKSKYGSRKIKISKKKKTNNNGENIKVVTISLNNDTYELNKDGKKKVKVKFNPSNASNKDISWKSKKSDIVTVDSDGTIVGHKKGTTTITATSVDNKNAKATAKIIVSGGRVAVKSVKVDPSSTRLCVGDTENVQAIVSPSDVSLKYVYWKSKDKKVATVDNGMIKGKKKGTTTITAISKSDETKKGNIKVNVIKCPKEISTADKKDIKILENISVGVGETKSINEKGEPWYKEDGFTYKSASKDIATIDSSGSIRGIKRGKTTITTVVKLTGGNKTYKTNVTVTSRTKVEKVNIPYDSIILKIGDSVNLNASVYPESNNSNSLIYSSSKKKIATVSKSGIVKGIKAGQSKITVTSNYDRTKKSSINVTVTKSGETTINPKVGVNSIVAADPEITIMSGKSVTLNIIKDPAASTETLSHKSSDTSVAKVNKKGTVKGYHPGQATITTYSTYNKNAKTTTIVNVTKDENGNYITEDNNEIKLNKTKLTLKYSSGKNALFEEEKLKATTSPANAKVTWTSSNSKVVKVTKNGKVTAVSKGEATVTAKANGKKATCKITVKKTSRDNVPTEGELIWDNESGKNISLNKTKLTLKYSAGKNALFEEEKLKAKTNPANAKVTWTSSNPKVATVNKNGKVTAVKKGKATITAKANGKKATCIVTVKKTSSDNVPTDNELIWDDDTTTTKKTTSTKKKTTTKKRTTTKKKKSTKKRTNTKKKTSTKKQTNNNSKKSSTNQIVVKSGENVSEHGNIYVGDSRFIGMDDACKLSKKKNNYVVAKEGMGYKWLTDSAASQVKKIKNNHKNIKYWNIIVGLGINDILTPGIANKYSNKYNKLVGKKDSLYILSVNPVKSPSKISKKDIENFNNIMKKNDNALYIDTYSIIEKKGFKTDRLGLHYDNATYKTICKTIEQNIWDWEIVD